MRIIGTINAALSDMTKSEYKVALFCIGNIEEIAFDTLEALAERISTSTTSVIRFCRRLGFAGYKELQEEVRRELKAQPSLPDKLERTISSSGGRLEATSRAVISCVERSLAETSEENISRAVDMICGAARVFTFGMKESYALAHYAYTRLLSVRGEVNLLSIGFSGEIEQLLSLGEGDVCVFYLFHRYTSTSLEVLSALKDRGVSVILVSSPPFSEEIISGSLLFSVYTDIGGVKNSAAAPIALTDCICNAVAVRLGDSALEYMRSSEELFSRFSILAD